jgi:putative transposase
VTLIPFVTPSQRHRGEDIAILQQRKTLYAVAKTQRPERWSGSTRDWHPEKIVYFNPNKSTQREVKNTNKAA